MMGAPGLLKQAAVLALLAVLLLPARAWCAPVSAPHVQVDLVASEDSIQGGNDALLGVKFTLENGWHIYWKNPGDSGEPPTVRWTLPPGFIAGALQWPVPKRISVGPLMNFGYDGTVLLPTHLQVPADLSGATSVDIQAQVKWLVCDPDSCIPGAASLSLTLPVGTHQPGPSASASLFNQARADLPLAMPKDWTIAATVQGDTVSLRVRNVTAPLNPPPVFFPSARDAIEAAAPQTFVVEPSGFRLELQRWQQATAAAESLAGVLVIGARGYTIAVPVGGPAAGIAFEPLVLAFIGGLLLNLMPCVFPVLAIKAFGLMRLGGHARRRARLHGILYACGILVSFWALAGGLLALRATGEQLGWGFQLQSPAFVAILASLFFWMALVLLGVCTVGGSLMGVGNHLTEGDGLGSAFFTGVLATVVATPCAAPFMGTAIGYALAQPPTVALGVFTFLGLGLALPYVVITAVPAIARRLPRPGRWMETLKELLAFPLLATVVWLIWVVSLQGGSAAVLTVLVALLMLGFAAWVIGHWRVRWARVVAAAFVVVALLAELSLVPIDQAPRAETAGALAWEPYSTTRLAELLQQEKPVFVDFTAAWCVTCQVNERVALGTEAVGHKMRELGVVAVRADWTKADPDITRALQEFGRDGVPLYVLYSGRKDDPPRILPQLLTSEIVLAELDQLKTRSGT